MSNTVSMDQVKDAIGEDAFKIFVDKFTGMIIYVRKNYDGQFPDVMTRDECIRKDFYLDGNYDRVAQKFDLSKSTIYRIIANR